MANKPKRLMYPTGLIDRRVFRLQRDLRLFYHRMQRGLITRSQVDLNGQFAIRQSYRQAEQDIKAWLEKKGLTYSGDRSELTDALKEALKRWRLVVQDF